MTMRGERCFEVWAPDASPWSAWAKPVLFSQLDGLGVQARPTREWVGSLPRHRDEIALVVELEGRDAVEAGLELARRGWRPVPLFNATMAPRALVDMVSVMEALLGGAPVLEGIDVRLDAPPAFLLDSRRMLGHPRPGAYDNRSIVLPQDFPSATMLVARGIRSVVWVRRGVGKPAEDLRHVLLRWQQAGLGLRHEAVDGGDGDLIVDPPTRFRKAWYALIALLGLRRSNVGGFGAIVPEATSGGYG